MAKQTQKSQTIDLDFDLDGETEKVAETIMNGDDSDMTLDLGEPQSKAVDEFADIQIAQPPPAKASGLAVMDYAAFEQGIEDISAESESFIKGLVYGKIGTGKTYMSGTFPEPRLFLDIRERGLKSVVGADGDQKKRVVDTFEMFMMAYFYLKSGNHPFKTVVLDNITNLQKLILNYCMGKEENWDPTVDKDMPSKREYGYLSQYMQTWIINFRNLPMNVVFIAQEKAGDDTDLDSDEPVVFPLLTQSVRGIVGGAVDFVGQTYVRSIETTNQETGKIITTPKFCMRIGPNPRYQTKIRLPQTCTKLAPAAIGNPTYAKIKKIMEGDF